MGKAYRVAALLAFVALSACGYVPSAHQPGDQVASGVRSPSPPQQSPTSYSTPFSNCPNPGPSPRSEVGAAYDPIHKVTVIFGGDLTATTTFTSETWTFDGRCWAQMHPAAAPSARQASGALVFDPVVGKTLLVGGRASPQYPTDAWLWDGTNWAQLSGAPRFGKVNAVYDEIRRAVVVYGEFTASGNPLEGADYYIWTWDGVTWTKLSPAHMPPPRPDGQMCYDNKSGTTLLFGGANEPTVFGDTWEWNGTDWFQDQPKSSPPPRFGATMTCGNNRVILAGGADAIKGFTDVWTWDGSGWSQLQTVHLPTGMVGAGGAFDGTRYFVLLGIPHTSPVRSEVWAFDGTDWSPVAAS